jgi:formylglycine-generating enzyme required for sulfatase activity
MASGATTVSVTVNSNKSNEVNFTVQSQALVIVEMVEIPAGTFMMGHPDPLKEDAYPQHKVTFTKPLLVAKTEITQAQYKKIMNQLNPSQVVDDNNPVEQLKWFAACDFCNRLSKLEGYTEAYIIDGTDVTWNKSANGYRLLTEAEWEYACRAGSTGAMGRRGGVEAAPNDIAWTADNANAMKHVGLLKPNDFGLYDMQGNAAEWVWDYYDYYGEDDETNPTGPSDGVERVFRGGGYIDSPTNCATYKRFSINGLQVQYYIGFRICRTK